MRGTIEIGPSLVVRKTKEKFRFIAKSIRIQKHGLRKSRADEWASRSCLRTQRVGSSLGDKNINSTVSRSVIDEHSKAVENGERESENNLKK